MIRAIIIDDDSNLRIGLRSLIAKYTPQIQVVGEADSVLEGIKTIENIPADVIFLDIQLGDGTGFDILDAMIQKNRKVTQQVVFITAFEQYAIKAFRFSALDYLLKPVDPEDFEEVVSKILKVSSKPAKSGNIEVLMENIHTKNENYKRIILSTLDGMEVVEIKDIIRCESVDNYTRFHTKNLKPILISKTLKEYEEMLSPFGFERIHQSHLVNMSSVKSFITKDGFFAVLEDQSLLPVSLRKKERFIKLLKSS